MERLTHEADFGLEDWEETLFFVKSDPNGAYNIIDIAKYQGEPEFDEILKNVALRLAAYEETGLEPEEVSDFDRLVKLYLEAGLDKQFVLACIEATKAGITVDRLHELAQADREGRCVVLPKDRMVYFHEESIDSGEKWVGNWPIKDILLKCGFGIASLTYSIRDVGNKIYFDRNEAQAALRRERDEA